MKLNCEGLHVSWGTATWNFEIFSAFAWRQKENWENLCWDDRSQHLQGTYCGQQQDTKALQGLTRMPLIAKYATCQTRNTSVQRTIEELPAPQNGEIVNYTLLDQEPRRTAQRTILSTTYVRAAFTESPVSSEVTAGVRRLGGGCLSKREIRIVSGINTNRILMYIQRLPAQNLPRIKRNLITERE